MYEGASVALALVGALTIGVAPVTAQRAPGAGMGARAGGPGIEAILSRKDALGLTDEQVASLEALREELRASMEPIREDAREAREEAREAARHRREQVRELRERTREIRQNGRKGVEEILGGEQLERLREVRMQRRGRAWRGGARHRGFPAPRFGRGWSPWWGGRFR